jgi:SAM-dependent methyltransferase
MLVPPHLMPIVNAGLGDGAFATLVRLFVLDVPVSQAEATTALSPLSLQDAVALGVVGLGRSRVHASIHLTPTEHGIFASDPTGPNPMDTPADFVMGIADSTRLLESFTIRRSVELALDLGTGCGYHAILVSRHAEKVVATDVNPRALEYAQFNAQLNGVDNVEFRRGDLFAPVEGLTFDSIVTNPPFVISPERTYVYRDAGRVADEFTRDIVQTLPRYLRPGGIAHLLANWIYEKDGSWSAPLEMWLADSNADGWFLRKATYDPLEYIYLWNQRLGWAGELQRYHQVVERWMRYFAANAIGAIAYGGIILRRGHNGTRGWTRADELPDGPIDPSLGGDLDRLLRAHDHLASLDEDQLLDQRLAFDADSRLNQVLRWREGAFKMVDASLVRDRGLRTDAEVTPGLARLFANIDGARTLREVLYGMSVGEPARADVLGVVRQLVAYGFLQLQS